MPDSLVLLFRRLSWIVYKVQTLYIKRKFLKKEASDQWRRNEFESGGKGGTGPAQKWGHQSGRAPENFLLVVPLHFFDSKSTISRFGKRFRDGQYSLVCFLFAVLLLTVPPCPAFF